MTVAETVNIFKTPITTFKQGKVVQKLLLSLAATADETLASKRSLAILEDTELRSVFLAVYPSIKITSSDIGVVNDLISIQKGLLPYHLVITRALEELRANIPGETVSMLRDHLVKESVDYYIAVCTFIVQAMTLIEAGEL